jgi:hypothetical protein
MMRRMTILGFSLALAACGGDDGTGDNGSNGSANGSANGGGDNCSGGAFTINWTGDRSGSATGDCVVSVFLSSGLQGSISALEENAQGGGETSLILNFNRPELTLAFAVFSAPELGEDAACGVGDFIDGTIEDAVNFTRNDETGFSLDFAFPVVCCLDGGLACDESLALDLQVSGTISSDNPI